MVPTPICIFFACREFNKKNSKKIQKKGHFKGIFEKKKNIRKTIKTKFSGWGFLFPGTASNDKWNGTYPPSVSFLYVENLTKKNRKRFTKKDISKLFFEKKYQKNYQTKILSMGFPISRYCIQ